MAQTSCLDYVRVTHKLTKYSTTTVINCLIFCILWEIIIHGKLRWILVDCFPCHFFLFHLCCFILLCLCFFSLFLPRVILSFLRAVVYYFLYIIDTAEVRNIGDDITYDNTIIPAEKLTLCKLVYFIMYMVTSL